LKAKVVTVESRPLLEGNQRNQPRGTLIDIPANCKCRSALLNTLTGGAYHLSETWTYHAG
jgi:hypothetical protein